MQIAFYMIEAVVFTWNIGMYESCGKSSKHDSPDSILMVKRTGGNPSRPHVSKSLVSSAEGETPAMCLAQIGTSCDILIVCSSYKKGCMHVPKQILQKLALAM